MGTPEPAAKALERLIDSGHEIAAVYTQPDRPAGRGKRLTPSPVKMFAEGRGLRVVQPVSVKTPEAIDEFKSHEANVAVVVAYGRILPQAFLECFRYGAINVHYSLLPKYRGAAPVNWAIVNGEKATGVTTMRMDVGLDTGDILLQREIAIGPTENSVELMRRLAEVGADLLIETLANIDTIEARPQDHSTATLAPIMKKSDGLIDWSLSASKIVNRIRGFQPYPTAFTFLNGTRVTIWSAEVDVDSGEGAPGEIFRADGEKWMVQCGEGTLLTITEAQQEGKRRMPAKDVINGLKPGVGEKFANNAEGNV